MGSQMEARLEASQNRHHALHIKEMVQKRMVRTITNDLLMGNWQTPIRSRPTATPGVTTSKPVSVRFMKFDEVQDLEPGDSFLVWTPASQHCDEYQLMRISRGDLYTVVLVFVSSRYTSGPSTSMITVASTGHPVIARRLGDWNYGVR